MKNEIFQYEGNAITFQSGDGSVMVNATEMARSFNKKPYDWLRLPSTEEYIKALKEARKTYGNELVITKRGGLEAGTWIHKDLALEFAQWLSPAFAVWRNAKIKELLTKGQTSMGSQDQDAVILQAYEMLKQRVNLQSEELKKQAIKRNIISTKKAVASCKN